MLNVRVYKTNGGIYTTDEENELLDIVDSFGTLCWAETERKLMRFPGFIPPHLDFTERLMFINDATALTTVHHPGSNVYIAEKFNAGKTVRFVVEKNNLLVVLAAQTMPQEECVAKYRSFFEEKQRYEHEMRLIIDKANNEIKTINDKKKRQLRSLGEAPQLEDHF